jgi:hypothetical protein
MTQYPFINFTVTTCSRLELFIKTMDSFLSSCLDKDLIVRWILCDDHSSSADIIEMNRRYPFFEILRSPKRGQAASLNFLFAQIKSDWFFHCEDDWLFQHRGNFIRRMFDVAFHDHMIRNITLRKWTGNEQVTRNGIKYNLHRYFHQDERPPQQLIEQSDCRWFGYTLNPGLQHLATVKQLGEYDERYDINSRFWDRPQAEKYLKLGYKRANLLDFPIEHIGEGKSAYSGW